MLGRNAALLERFGTLVPHAGRPAIERGPSFMGHHNLGMEVLRHPDFVPGDGTLDDLSVELAATRCERAIVSAESLCFAHHAPGGLKRIRDAVTSAGFEPIVVFYFRGQAAYARSIYAMRVVTYGARTSLRTFCEDIFNYRGLCSGREVAPFEYDRLLKPFENVFGKSSIVTRAFDADVDPGDFSRDFLSIVHPMPLDREALHFSNRLNVGATLATVMDALHASRAALHPGLPTPRSIATRIGVPQATLDRGFDPLDARLSKRFSDEFAASNERLREAYGVTIDNPPPKLQRTAEEQLAFIAACEAAWKNAGPQGTGVVRS